MVHHYGKRVFTNSATTTALPSPNPFSMAEYRDTITRGETMKGPFKFLILTIFLSSNACRIHQTILAYPILPDGSIRVRDLKLDQAGDVVVVDEWI